MIARALAFVLALVLLGAAQLVGERAAEARSAASDPDQLLYLPEGRVLRAFSMGHRSLVADLVWLQAIQYYGEQRLTTRNYDQAERLFRVIYDLDPQFKGATRFGALVLAQDAGNPDAAIGLLARAERDDPGAWEYPFDRGFIEQTVRRDFAAAGDAYRRAADLPGAPTISARLAGMSFARLGDRDAAREVWRAVFDEADNDLMREVAERNLLNLDMEDAEDRLEKAAARFAELRGGLPRQWGELVEAGILTGIPAEPWGGRFLIDPGTGEVWSTTRLDRRMAQERDVFQDFVRLARNRDGRWPRTLGELAEQGIARFPPWRPMGLSLDYDPATGRVAWNPPWPAVEARTHGEGPA